MKTLHDCVINHNNIFDIRNPLYRNWLARIAVYYCFMLEGAYTGVWGRYLPKLQDKLQLSDSLLGTSVLFLYLGTTIVTPLVAFLLRRYGSRFVTILGAWLFIASLPFIALSNSFGLLVFTQFVFGFTEGIMDLSMNNSAILTEIVAGKPLLGSFHGSYSVAAALGSLLGGAFIGFKLLILTAFLITMAAASFLSLLTFVHMYDNQQEAFLTNYHEQSSSDDGDKDNNNNENGYDAFDHGITGIDDSSKVITPNSKDDTQDHQQQHNPLITETSAHHLPPVGTAGVGSTHPGQVMAAAALGSNSNNLVKESNERSDIEQPLLQKKRDRKQQKRQSLTHDNEEGDDNENRPSLSMGKKNWQIVAIFAAIGFLAAFGESSIVTWSVVFFDRNLPQATSVEKSLGFTCFMVCMALGRFCCDYIRRVIGRRYMMRVGGFLALCGLMVVVVSVNVASTISSSAAIAIACLGFSCTGIGLSTLIPTVFSSVGHLPGVHAGSAIALAAGLTYAGSIVSAPLIGVLSDGFGSLQYALLVDGLILGLIIPLSFGVIPETMIFRDHQDDHGYKAIVVGPSSTDTPSVLVTNDDSNHNTTEEDAENRG